MGQSNNSISGVCVGSHFTWEERLRFESFLLGRGSYDKIKNKTKLAKIFDKSIRTIRREINRGLVLHQKANIPFEALEYNAEHAQLLAVYKSPAKGPIIKMVIIKNLKKLLDIT